MSVTFYRCAHCGNIIEKVIDNGPKVVCCGEPMGELVANTTDAATEKHVPVVERDGNRLVVSVGSVAHPMTEEHYIQFIVAVTDNGVQRVNLTPADKPQATFEGEGFKEVYEYCNLHGLWKTEL